MVIAPEFASASTLPGSALEFAELLAPGVVLGVAVVGLQGTALGRGWVVVPDPGVAVCAGGVAVCAGGVAV